MLDPQRIVEEIQAALLNPATLDWDLLSDASAEYAAACDDVNERLERCGKLLKQGLRGESLQLAEQEPNLLDCVAILDFPELAHWQQTLAANNMVLPPPLRLEIAADLNTAYAVEAPLRPLLKQHRLLALARASLADRIEVLRRLRQVDATNPVWAEDQAALETARLQAIRKEADHAVKERDEVRLAELCGELRAEGWQARPPAPLVERLQEQLRTVAAQRATDEMAEVEPLLSEAYAAFDTAAGRKLRNRWLQAVGVAGGQADPELLRRAAPALAWLAEDDERETRARGFAAAVAELDRAIDEEATRSVLERLYNAATRFEEEIPARVERRYQERLQVQEIAGRRRFVLLSGAVVGVLVLIAAGTGWLILRQQQAARLKTTVAALTRLIDDGQWTEAQDYLSALGSRAPDLASATEVQSEAARLLGLIQAEEQRRERFRRHMEQAGAAGLDNPDLVALEEARKIAELTDEKLQVRRFEVAVAEHERDKLTRRDGQFAEELRELVNAVEQAEASASSGAGQEADALTVVLGRIDELQRRGSGASQPLTAQLPPLRRRVEALARAREQNREQTAAVAGITAAVGDIEAFQRALQAFADRFPMSPLAPEFRRALEGAPAWQSLEQWQAFLKDQRLAKLAELSPREAQKLLESGDALVDIAGECPLAEHFRERREHLATVSKRVDSSGKSRLDGLEAVFDDALVASLWMVQNRAGDRFYLTSDPRAQLQFARANLQYVVDFDLETKGMNVGREEIVVSGKAPQAALASAARTQLKLIRDGEWERGFFALIRLLAEEKNTDPLLQFILLRRALETAREGSHCLQTALSRTWDKVESADVDLTANWLLPGDAAAQRARTRAAAVLRSLDLAEEGKQAAELLRKHTAPLPAAPQWIGWLRPQSSARWTCEVKEVTHSPGRLYVLARRAEGAAQAWQWMNVGEWNSNGPQFERSVLASLTAGQPVYWIPAPTSAGAAAR